MKIKKSLAGLASAACVLVAMQSSVLANPFGGILNTINQVNGTINAVDRTINGTAYTINSLSETLGISGGDVGNEDDPTAQVMSLYQTWHSGLAPAEQETVSWLVMEHARNQGVTFDTISESDWFLQKPATEQSQVAATYFKLQSLLDASAQDSNRFLGYAFCVNAGSADCAK